MSVNSYSLIDSPYHGQDSLWWETNAPHALLPEAARIFKLKSGDSLALGSLHSADYLHVAHGHVQIHINGLMEAEINTEHTPRAKVFTLPVQCESVKVAAMGDSTVLHVNRTPSNALSSLDPLCASLLEGDLSFYRKIRVVCESKVFCRLPFTNIKELVRRMQVRQVSAGEEVVRQGCRGGEYCILESGRAEVWRMGLYDDEPQRVGALGPGDVFGEEAVVGDGSHEATIRMIEDGALLLLSKSDFNELIAQAMISEVAAPVAKALLEDGHELLDVRYEEEHAESHIPGCRLLPLHDLRQRLQELPRDKKYVVYCRSGRRSAVAALLMSQAHYHAASLKGGINAWLYEKASVF